MLVREAAHAAEPDRLLSGRPILEEAVSQSNLRILMVTSEVDPFAKIGGLADMVGSLARQLASTGVDVRIVLPRYYVVDIGKLRRIDEPLGVPVGGGEEWCAIYTARLPRSEVTVYFLDHEELYGRDGVYGTRMEPSFDDNLRRFTVLCRGALQLARRLDWVPDVIHCHDWPGALVPAYLDTLEAEGPFSRTASVFTIHNMGYQGEFPVAEFSYTGFDRDQFRSLGFELDGQVNLLQAGITNADILTTVSPTYAAEIQTPEFGHGLDNLLRARASDPVGVLNGADYETWNPETDPHLAVNYSHRSLGRKAKNKAVLQAEMGLPEDPGVPLYGMVSRLVEQKGFGALCGPDHGRLFSICDDFDLQFVILGTGEAWCEEELRTLSARLPNLAVKLDFDNRLAHSIMAGSDFFPMPSRYEPCGLSQMYALRYGTLPIVRRTGGLADTVDNYDQATGDGTGFVFDELTPSAIYDTVGWALWTWHHRAEHLTAMRKRAMKARFSWADSAQRYVGLYREALERRTRSEAVER
jgi:starch synthase